MKALAAVKSKRFLVISDLQMPFENEKALGFCSYLRRHYDIPEDGILNVGDETDCLHGGLYPKDPNGHHTPNSEIRAVREKFKEWGSHFPRMKIAISNHGLRWLRKATASEIPEQLLRSYEDIFEAPGGWKWAHEWKFANIKYPFRIIHGMGYSGINGARNAAIDAGMSTVIGHLHSYAGISYVRTGGSNKNSGLNIWGMNAGCLIDIDSYAFKYGSDSRNKPCLGASVILDDGKTPIWHALT